MESHGIDLDGKVTALRDITLGPTPSTAVPLDATSVLVLRAATADLRRVPLTGDTPEHVVLSGLTGRMSAPTLSPDGQWIAVRRATSGAPAGQFNVIELARADGTSQSTVQLPFTLANSLPQIVRGGTDLVVAEGRPQSGEPGVYLVHVATQQETRLFSYSAQVPAPELVLSPDGRTLLYSQWEMVESAVVSVNLASRKTPKR